MSLFKQDPLDAEIKRLEKEQRELQREAKRLAAQSLPSAREEAPAPAPAPKPPKIVFDHEEEAVASAPVSFRERKLLKVEQKKARNRVIALAFVLMILVVLATRALS